MKVFCYKCVQGLFLAIPTIDFLSKKHINSEQGLDFVVFSRENEDKSKKSQRNTNNSKKKLEEQSRKSRALVCLRLFSDFLLALPWRLYDLHL